MARCVKELVTVEFRSVAKEFIEEAKLLNLGSNWNTAVTFGSNANLVPAELAAAKIFDLHLAAPSLSDCASATLDDVNGNPVNCIVAAQGTSLWTQRDLSSVSTLNALTNQVKSFGLGSLNAYLSKLALQQVPYSGLHDNLFLDLHGSSAEYAINFGILENILARDSRADNATFTCTTNLQLGPNQIGFENFMNVFLTAAKTRTLCTLLQDMSSGLQPINVGASLHQRMFRKETPTGLCV
jgi:hypothetical protein